MNNPIVLIISDLHLGDGKNSDDFEYGKSQNIPDREERLINFINSHNPGKIYFNGDVYEAWQFRMKKIRKAHPKIIQFIEEDERVTAIIGNHDFSINGVSAVEFTTNNNKYVLITHGHSKDKCFKTSISRFFSWILGCIERIIPGIDNHFARKKFWNKDLRDRVRNYAKELFQKGYDIVICGHCHVQELSEIEGHIYANCGACQEGRLEGVLLNTETGEVKLVSS